MKELVESIPNQIIELIDLTRAIKFSLQIIFLNKLWYPMNQLQRRSVLWQLNSLSSEVLQYVKSAHRHGGLAPTSEIVNLLSNLGVDPTSTTLKEIIEFSVEEEGFVDINAFFNVVSESVLRVKNRNLLFWNTVMTVSGASIAWIDFRRKFSRWLSANGMGIGHSKTVLSFVQSNVDRTNSGVVRKDTFLKFAEDLMGIESLLNPEGLVAVDNANNVKVESGFKKPIPQRIAIIDKPRNVTKPASTPPLPLNNQESHMSIPLQVEPMSPIIVEYVSDASSSSSRQHAHRKSEAIEIIRMKLAISAIQKVLVSRIRFVFSLCRISKLDTEIELKKSETKGSARMQARFLGLCLRLILQRIISKALRRLSIRQELPGLPDDYDRDVTEDAAGPSWTVTIQAVAVSNLFGILRTSLARALIPAFFSLRAGRPVDDYCPVRTVSWAQSKQGKKDSQAALQINGASILKPINENIAYEGIEFDLSS